MIVEGWNMRSKLILGFREYRRTGWTEGGEE